MSLKKYLVTGFTAAFLLSFFMNAALAFNPGWKEEQDQMFSQIAVKPGDVITAANVQKLEGLVPDGVINWVKKGEWTIKIAEMKFDFSPDEQWIKDSQKNEGKYAFAGGKLRYMVDAKTGAVPQYVYGYPFPTVDVKGDPDGVIKLMYNVESEISRAGSQYNHGASMDWMGESGFERANIIEWIRYSFWHRPDGEQPNPSQYKFMEMLPVTKPYDSKGVVSMFYRQANGESDIVYTYIPAIRRVKRMSGANRSDPTLGSDTCMDDAGGWSGDNSSMQWKYIDEKITLLPMLDYCTVKPNMYTEEKDGTWIQEKGTSAAIPGYEIKGHKGATWEITNMVWVPRKTYVVQANPLDPYYTYGRSDLYVDKDANRVAVKTVYDKAFEYWKVILSAFGANDWGTKRSFNVENILVAVDDKTHHASGVFANGIHGGEAECYKEFNDKDVNREMFTPGSLKMWSK